jgi:iron complex outermembrane recepter protein
MKASRRSLLLSAVAISTLAAQAALAQTPDARSEGTIEEVVVTARRTEENLQSVPVAVTALGQADLAKAQIREFNDIQSKVPNMVSAPSAGSSQAVVVGMRGQLQKEILLSVDPAVGIYIDGVSLPRPYGLRMSLVDLQRVEVLRGPQGTLYGKNTTGGAINIITADPDDSISGSIGVTAGNRDRLTLTGVLSVPITDQLGVRLVAQRDKHGAYGRDLNGRALNNEDAQYYRAKFKFEGETVTATLTGAYQQSRTKGPVVVLTGVTSPANVAKTCPGVGVPGCVGVLEAAVESAGAISPATIGQAYASVLRYVGGVGGDLRHTGGTAAPQFSDFYGWSLAQNVSIKVSENVELRSISGFQNLRQKNFLDLDGTPFTLLNVIQWTEDNIFSQEFQVVGGGASLDWVAGVYGSYEDGSDNANGYAVPLLNPNAPNLQRARVKNKSAAVYGQFNWRFAPRWSATIGGRYSQDVRILTTSSGITAPGGGFICLIPAAGVTDIPPGPAQCPRTFEKTYKAPSWLASVSYQATDDILTYLKASRGYRSGGMNLRGTGSLDALAPFAPEYTTEYELGIKSSLLDRRLRLNLAGFIDDYTNIQRSVTIASSTSPVPITRVSNAASATIKGLEGEVLLKIFPQLTLSASGGLTDAKYKRFVDTSGDRSGEKFNVPKWTTSLGAVLDVPTEVGDVSVSADYHWQSKIVLAPEAIDLAAATQKGYGLLDLRAGVTLQKAGVEVALWGKNVLGKDYLVNVSTLETALGYLQGHVGDPRTFGIEIKKRFGGN